MLNLFAVVGMKRNLERFLQRKRKELDEYTPKWPVKLATTSFIKKKFSHALQRSKSLYMFQKRA